jgi:hypothetical protein
MEKYRIFVKRIPGSIHCQFTMKEYFQNPDGTIREEILFDKIPCTSGQVGYLSPGTKDDWTRGKGGTPIGDWWLWLEPLSLNDDPSHTVSGIGEVWPIGTETEKDFIRAVDAKFKGLFRSLCRWHCDNLKPGTIGCTAAKLWSDFHRVSKKLLEIKKSGIKKIRYTVFV